MLAEAGAARGIGVRSPAAGARAVPVVLARRIAALLALASIAATRRRIPVALRLGRLCLPRADPVGGAALIATVLSALTAARILARRFVVAALTFASGGMAGAIPLACGLAGAVVLAIGVVGVALGGARVAPPSLILAIGIAWRTFWPVAVVLDIAGTTGLARFVAAAAAIVDGPALQLGPVPPRTIVAAMRPPAAIIRFLGPAIEVAITPWPAHSTFGVAFTARLEVCAGPARAALTGSHIAARLITPCLVAMSCFATCFGPPLLPLRARLSARRLASAIARAVAAPRA